MLPWNPKVIIYFFLLPCSFLSRLLTGVLQHHLGWIRSFCEMPGSETTECCTTETSHAVSWYICMWSVCVAYHACEHAYMKTL